MIYDIFISYKRKSLATANNLYYRLTTRGYSTFFDLEEMRRDNFNVQLLNYIENAKDVFVILEEGSLDACKKGNWEDDWFCKEIAHALKTKRNIIPILIGDYKMPKQEFFPNELQELSLKNAPEFSFSYFEEYLNKLIEKGYITAEAEIKDKTTSIFKFYSNENCQVFKEGKLVCSLEGMSDEPYYLPVTRKGDYRFKAVNNTSGKLKIINEAIDVVEEKNVEVIWTNRQKIVKPFLRKRKGCGILLSFVLILAYVIFLVCSPRWETWKYRIKYWSWQTIDIADLSQGKLYGGHEAIDLGLSVKWSNCFVGAEHPSYDGDMYAWGETKTKKRYDWCSYQFYHDNKINKYCINEKYGVVDGLTNLCASDDVANVKWGNGWRMPTYEETVELKEKCTFINCMLYGKPGLLVTGPNGNRIFLPFSGDKSDEFTGGDGVYTIFWTSSLFTNDKAYEFAMSQVGNYWNYAERNIGHCIRPVHE